MIKKCKNCLNDFETKRKSKQHCSNKCFQEYRKKPDVLLDTINKRKKSNIEKYGVDNAAKSNIIKEKTKQTCLKKYGVVSPTLVKEIHQKQISTCIKKYGVKNPQQNEYIKKKQKNSLFNNYGVYVPLKNLSIVNKVKKTCLEKYGVDNSAKYIKTKQKAKQTCLKKYNSSCPMLNEVIKNKVIKNRLINHYNNVIKINKKYNSIIPLFKENDYNGNVSYITKYMFKCKVCNNEFKDTLLSGHIPRCPVCYPSQTSKPQTEIYDFIKSLLPLEDIQKNNRKIIPPLELDIYIPSKKLAIEFNGLYWHSELGGKKYKNYHLNKTNKCSEIGIKLIHIFEDEWIEKQNIIKNKLKHILGLIDKSNKIYARNCVIKEIESKESNTFLELYHSQGIDKSSLKIGAYHKNELVSVMTFGKLRLALGNKSSSLNEYEMYRFCIGEKTVIGISNKLLNFFISKYNPKKIITYADRRYSDKSAFYTKVGFKLIKNTTPNYWYIDKNYMHRYYRYNFIKHKLKDKLKNFNPNLTEWQNMQANGWDRIWDCGHLKFEWNA